MRNTLVDLNNYLFEQLERLNDDSMSADELEREISKARTVTQVASVIVQNGELALRTIHAREEYGLGLDRREALPAILKIGDE